MDKRIPSHIRMEIHKTLMVLADFSKAFDTVCFKTTINKLYHVGFSKNFLEWLANYLCGRQHYVQINDRRSSLAQSEFGEYHKAPFSVRCCSISTSVTSKMTSLLQLAAFNMQTTPPFTAAAQYRASRRRWST